ncbi:CHASE2 domain-containing protein [candidate division KSB1 bacterium]|nr:CHASE2 domain-containing protein [candidate division KSB1 bacterium]
MQKTLIIFKSYIFWLLVAAIGFIFFAGFWQSLSLRSLFILRGERDHHDSLYFVTIGARDAEDLGGWPISRDYYGLISYILQENGAKSIAFDVLFHRRDERYPEYDQALIDFISSGPVALAMAFQSLQDSTRLDWGRYPSRPFPALDESVAAAGFSNVGDQFYALQAPVAVESRFGTVYSLGVQTARLALNCDALPEHLSSFPLSIQGSHGKTCSLPINKKGRVWLNHFGDFTRVRQLSLTNLLRRYRDDENLAFLQDRIVFVGVTIPGVASTVMTPFDPASPAFLIHATVTENILQQNFIRVLPLWARILLTAIFVAALMLPLRWGRRKFVFLSLLFFAFFIVIAVILFSWLFIALPLVLPLLIGLLALLTTWMRLRGIQIQQHRQREQAWEQEVSEKQKQIVQTRQDLQRLQTEQNQHQQSYQAVAEEKQKLMREKQELLEALQARVSDLQPQTVKSHEFTLFPEIIRGHKSKLQESLQLLHTVRDSDLPVLFVGETGSGKEVLAQALVRAGQRRDKPLIAVNCGAISETLLESELFGHEKGAFTGAQARKRGYFEQADGGTLFLDEISETSEAFQIKLLRVLQEGVIQRVGDEHAIHIDVRILAASNRDLEKDVRQGRFRQDLYYRLNAFPVPIPPLRQRPQDIPPLADYFLKKHSAETVRYFSQQAINCMQSWSWPGNVRELENIVQRAAILASSQGRNIIQSNDLPEEMRLSAPETVEFKSLAGQILDSLRAKGFSHASVSQSARELGNRDRSTIAEYLRGMCYEALVHHHGDENSAARELAATLDPQVIERVRKKIAAYRKKLETTPPDNLYKGLPRQYHDDLKALLNAGNSRS